MKNTLLSYGKLALLVGALSLTEYSSGASRQMENLDRGVVAVKVSNGVFISWRYLGTDNPAVGFNIYRNGTKINDKPINDKTNYTDAGGSASSSYVVKAVLNNKEVETSATTKVWDSQTKTINLKRPGSNYAPNDMSAGDVDGDGQYELILKWNPSNAKDNSQSGNTDNVYLDCYELDGTFKWRIDLGVNIRAGAHYTQFQVYDYDGDGKAEVACKTAPGTKDGKGKYVIMGNDDPKKDYRNGSGYVLSGPEYLTMFNGETGAEMSTVKFNPERGNVSGWGDGYGNRVDRFLACTAYLDGVHPSLVMCRGYYTRSTITAYDFKNGKLVQRWYHNSDQKGKGAYGEGFHNVSVADVDNDGYDEIIYGSACIDHDGKLMYRTGYGHGDAQHVSKMDPSTNDFLGWFVHEEKSSAYGYELRNLKTGKVIFGKQTGTDNGRGMAADIDPKHKGFEMWSSAPNVYDCKGNVISSTKPSVNFRIYWDGDLQDELLDGTKCDKWTGNGTKRLITFTGQACNGTKNTPCLQADLFGDWREEVIFHNGADKIYINTTTIPTQYRLFTLMHDAVYRMGIAWQNTAYNQPPHLGFYIGDGIANVKQPDIYLAGKTTPSPQEPENQTMEVLGQLNQEIFAEENILPISFQFGGSATDVTVKNLPEGLSIKKSGNTAVISGSVKAAASFEVTTVGEGEAVTKKVSINLAPSGLKNVAYITSQTGENYAKDKVLTALKGCEDLYVREYDASLKNIDLSKFNLVVISEVTPSTAPIVEELKSVGIPMLSMKVHAYKTAEGAWNWAKAGYGDNTTATKIVVDSKFKNHPMFKDVTLDANNAITMFSDVDTKALTFMNPESLNDAEGTINTVATVEGEDQVCIFEMAPGTSVAGTVMNEPYIQIGLNSSSYGLITDDGLSVVKNACYYLLDYKKYNETLSADVTEQMQIDDLKIYNSENGIDIVLDTEDDDIANVRIYSTNGTMMGNYQFDVVNGFNRISIEKAFNQGVYLLNLKTSNKTVTKRFIK